MKLQLTTIAAALSLAMAMSATAADPRNPDYRTSELPTANTHNGGSGVFSDQENQRSNMNGYNGPSGERYSKIQQLQGTSNSTAIANQKGIEQDSRILQRSVDNGLADVTQGAGSTEQNESIVIQRDGSNLTARVRQIGGNGNQNLNDSYIRQTGDGHEADVLQRDSHLSDSIIYQDGTGGHLATVEQVNNTDETWSFISQNGSNEQHVADVLQKSAENSASYIFQAGTYGHEATVEQISTENSLSMVRQGANYGESATALHQQHGGMNNTAISFQW